MCVDVQSSWADGLKRRCQVISAAGLPATPTPTPTPPTSVPTDSSTTSSFKPSGFRPFPVVQERGRRPASSSSSPAGPHSRERLLIGPQLGRIPRPRRGAEEFHDREEIHPSNIPQERPPPSQTHISLEPGGGVELQLQFNLTPPTSAIFTAIIC